jgi:hypothetical protein
LWSRLDLKLIGNSAEPLSDLTVLILAGAHSLNKKAAGEGMDFCLVLGKLKGHRTGMPPDESDPASFVANHPPREATSTSRHAIVVNPHSFHAPNVLIVIRLSFSSFCWMGR